MKRKFLTLRLLSIILIFISYFNFINAGVTEKLERVVYPQELDFKDVKLADALSLISKTSGITIIAETAIKDTSIDLYFVKGQNLKEIIQALMLSNNLSMREINNIIIMEKNSKNQLTVVGQIIGHVKNKLTDKGFSDTKISLIKNGEVVKSVTSEVGGAYIIENIDPGTYIIKVLSEKYGESGDIVKINAGETLSINLYLNSLPAEEENTKTSTSDSLSAMNSMEILKKAVESQTETKLGSLRSEAGKELQAEKIVLKHAFAGEIKSVINALDQNVEITAVEKQNLVVVKGSQANIDTVVKLIRELDEPVKQVRITAQVLEMTDSLSQELGIDWSYNQGSSTTGKTTSLLGVTSGEPTATFTKYLSNSNEVFTATLKMLKTTDDASVSAVPSIVTVNGEAATIKVTEEEKVGETKTTDDDGITTTEPLYKEAGTTLVVTPIIREGEDEPDTITLEVALEVSSFKSGTDSEGAEQVNKTTTKVRVEDGGIVFIGGLKRKIITNVNVSVPYLSSLPFLGRFFSRDEVITNSTDLFIQIKAEIVTEENENQEIDVKGFKNKSEKLKTKIF